MTRMRATVSWEYDADPADYGALADDPRLMAEHDASTDPVEAVDFAMSTGKDVTFEVVPT